VVIITRRGESPEGGIYWVLEWRGLIITAPIREIQNYRNGGKPRENIPFEIKKMIDSKGMDSEGMEGKHKKIFGSKLESVDFKWLTLYVRNGFRWKIFRLKLESIDFKGSNLYVRNGFRWKILGSKWKVLISNGQTYMFGTDSVGKYFV
jgi:hypothetical protein